MCIIHIAIVIAVGIRICIGIIIFAPGGSIIILVGIIVNSNLIFIFLVEKRELASYVGAIVHVGERPNHSHGHRLFITLEGIGGSMFCYLLRIQLPRATGASSILDQRRLGGAFGDDEFVETSVAKGMRAAREG